MEKDVMKDLKQKSKSKKKKIIIIMVVVVLLLLVWFVQRSVRKAADSMQAVMAEMQTDEVSKRSLIKSVGATGTIISVDSKEVTASLTGADILDVKVEVGDEVVVGQELVVFDTSDIEESLESAQEQLATSKQKNAISAQNAQRSVEDAERTESYQVLNAKISMDNAYSNYKDAQEDYDSAVATLNDLQDKENKAYNNYVAAKEAASVSNGDSTEVASLLNEYNAAKASREAQQTKVNSLGAQLNSMASTYDNAYRTYENTVASQASSVASAKNSQKTSSLTSTTSTEEKQIEQYEEQLAEGILEAPIAGIVTAVNYENGDTYTQGTIITIQDCSSFEVETEIGEYDISDIQLGQKVLIKTDATREEELEGTVVFISPTATKSAASTEVTYTVRISVDTPNDRLRLDMSASLSIIIEEHDDVYTVPYNAVQTDELGNTFIEVIGEDGVATSLPVTIEMESNYYTEISADTLEEGMKIRVVDSEDNMTSMFEMMQQNRGGF